jgi:hypothetical protein
MRTYVRKAQAEGFRIHAIWDPAEAERLFGAQAAQYLRTLRHSPQGPLARADRVRELIKVEVAASPPAGKVVAR